MVNRVCVNSSAIAEIGYDEMGMILEVEFHGGAVYQYSGVPLELYRALISASSVGRLFDEEVRTGPFSCRRMS